MLARFSGKVQRRKVQRKEEMTGHKKSERRQYPRLDKQFSLKIVANGYDFITTTENISCVGAYCHVDKYVPPFTKIMVKLTLPIINNRRGGFSVECKGVVVRTEDSPEGGFKIAVFFNEINENQRKKISQYLSKFLPANTPQLSKRL